MAAAQGKAEEVRQRLIGEALAIPDAAEADPERAYNRLQRLMISIQDFQIAGSAATFLLEDVDETAGYPLAELRRFRCYETTMVIAYARPFSMARGAVMPLIIMTLPRFDEGMRFTYAEVERILEKLRVFVHTLTLDTQQLGIVFRDRFQRSA
jgi:hypothetical protein